MRRRFSALWGLAIAFAVLAPSPAQAAPKKGKPAVQAKAPKKGAKKPDPKADKADKAEAADVDADAEKSDAPDKGEPSKVKAAGTAATKSDAEAANAVKETKESKEGVKTYKFGTIEVEGRLKSPQIIYFLRRVRAEFDAGLLGHRSFMRELSDTRNKSALR